MYNIVPIFLIFLSLAIILVIISRKFSALANVDLSTIPAERESKFKEQIISNRLKRNYSKWSSKFFRVFLNIYDFLRKAILNYYHSLQKKREEYKNQDLKQGAGLKVNTKQRISFLFSEAEKNRKRENQAEQEKALIEIISLDSKSIKAFKLLGQLYIEKRELVEASQIFEHIIKLVEAEDLDSLPDAVSDIMQGKKSGVKKKNTELSQAYYFLSVIARESSDYSGSTDMLKKALQIEPSNPKYLDMLIELSIMNKDKILAYDTIQKLEKANPDNQKLEDFKKQISLL